MEKIGEQMPKFGTESEAQLATCHPDLVKVLREAIKYFDFKVEEGFRNQADQHKAFITHHSTLDWPHGNHNKSPSTAADCYPYPVDYSDNQKNLERFLWMHGVIDTVAQQLGIKIRHGVDWNGNKDERDEKGLRDYPHVELG